MQTGQLGNGWGGLGLFDNGDDLRIATMGCFHRNSLYRVARQFHFEPHDFSGDYP